jgi:hypothetical protein
MNPTFKAWAIAAMNALLSGAFAAMGSLAAGLTVKQAVIVVGFAAVGSFGKWYAQHPIPGGEQ